MGKGVGKGKGDWDRRRIHALRRHLGYSQQGMADVLGTRQQTISEWENGLYEPRGTSATLLGLVAEKAGFKYSPHESGKSQIPGTRTRTISKIKDKKSK